MVALDFDKRVLKHYRQNHPGVDAICFNLRLIAAAAKLLDFYGLLFLMCISPPCQGFSTASGAKGRRDRRRELIVSFTRSGTHQAGWRGSDMGKWKEIYRLLIS